MELNFRTLAASCAVALILGGGQALAHDGVEHGSAAEAEQHLQAAPLEDIPFDFQIGGAFELTDHRGRSVTDRDFHGSYLLVFFGYAQCESICPVGLGRMVQTVDLLGDDGAKIQPILITVDPKNDTVEALAAHVPKLHPRLVGLTGTPDQLSAARKAYRVDAKQVGQAWDGKPIFSHGSFLFLMRPDGSFGTLIPPVLAPEAMAKTIRKYMGEGSS